MTCSEASVSEPEARTRAYTVLLLAWTLGALVYALALPLLDPGPFFFVTTALFFFLVPVVLLVLVVRAAGGHRPYSAREPRYRLPPTRPGPRKPSLRGPW